MQPSTKWIIGGVVGAGVLYLLWSQHVATTLPTASYTLTWNGSTGLASLKDSAGNLLASTQHGGVPGTPGLISNTVDNADGKTAVVTYVPASSTTPVTVTATLT